LLGLAVELQEVIWKKHSIWLRLDPSTDLHRPHQLYGKPNSTMYQKLEPNQKQSERPKPSSILPGTWKKVNMQRPELLEPLRHWIERIREHFLLASCVQREL
jgi:hypothetical protein